MHWKGVRTISSAVVDGREGCVKWQGTGGLGGLSEFCSVKSLKGFMSFVGSAADETSIQL